MMTIKRRSDIHILRKVWHFAGVLFIIVVFHNLNYQTALIYISAGALLSVLVEFGRFRVKWFNRALQKVLAPVIRTNELNSISGLTAMLVGCWLAVLLFPREVVTLSLYFLATADPIASYFGLKYGRDKLVGNKTLQGSIASFVVCAVLSFLFYYSKGLMLDRLFVVSVLSGLAGSGAELFANGKIDDNFSIPVFGSLALWAIFYVFGGFIH